MAKRKRKKKPEAEIADYRHDAKRKNNPPAGLAAQGVMEGPPKVEYAYNPHLPPCLRFDDSGTTDKLPELLATAKKRALSDEEARTLAEALRRHEPWLEWSGKQERKGVAVDPVALHIHERISAQAILKIAAREDTRDMLPGLFADPQLEYREAVQFYQHNVDWANRMILGDSLQVMTSLSKREDLAGSVQMIYVDPPYGIKFASNFQPEMGNREVKERDADLTREPEMVKAYRDTWTLGVHSYLTYIRDRFIVARELLADTGSIFVQISDENVHRLRVVLDDVFGSHNFVSMVSYKTTQSAGSKTLDTSCDYLLWYARDIDKVKCRPLFKVLSRGEKGATRYDYVEDLHTGSCWRVGDEVDVTKLEESERYRFFTDQGLTSRGHGSDATMAAIVFEGHDYRPTAGHWRTTAERIVQRLVPAGRVLKAGKTLRFKKCFDDFGCVELSNMWDDVGGGIQSRKDPKVFVVQTSATIIQRCLLMTTEPGDLVLDPTCGGGTTAYTCEQWGRRWITIDTSRVALAIARQRLVTATFDFYRLYDNAQGPTGGFVYKTVPHVTLKNIVYNEALDPIVAEYEPLLAEALSHLNAALAHVPSSVRHALAAKLAAKQKAEGKRNISEADRRRWQLPKTDWDEWGVPFDSDPDWPEDLASGLDEYRNVWRDRMRELNSCISANADQEHLVDQPEIDRSVVRVAGPFTMEAVMPAEDVLASESPVGGTPERLQSFGDAADSEAEAVNAEAYLEKMLRLLKADGVRFPNNVEMQFEELELSGGEFLHAEGEWAGDNGKPRRVAVSFGPEHGPVTSYQVQNAIRQAFMRGVHELVFAGFSFDAQAQADIQSDPNPEVRVHLAHITPDVNMGDLLKETSSTQLFTVFGSPRTKPEELADGQFQVTMEGVDIYDPVENTLHPTDASKVAAWFLDSNYDGRTFCVTQAFFPDKSAWKRLAKALKGKVDEDAFAKFNGTVSLPFPLGAHKRCAVKVIDPRGNEVMSVHLLGDKGTY